jgi:hypothetical protein
LATTATTTAALTIMAASVVASSIEGASESRLAASLAAGNVQSTRLFLEQARQTFNFTSQGFAFGFTGS